MLAVHVDASYCSFTANKELIQCVFSHTSSSNLLNFMLTCFKVEASQALITLDMLQQMKPHADGYLVQVKCFMSCGWKAVIFVVS